MISLSDTFLRDRGRFELLLRDDAFWEKRESEMHLRHLLTEQQEAKEAADRRARRIAEIPDIYREPFEGHRCALNEWVVEHVLNWQPDGALGIGLVGPTGICKTRLLVSALLALPARFSWRYLPAMRLSSAVEDLSDDDSRVVQKARRLLDDARKVRVLLLDDLGDEKSTEAVSAELKALVEHRTSRRLPLLWTTQLEAAQIEEKHGERGKAIVRRLREFSTMAWTTGG